MVAEHVAERNRDFKYAAICLTLADVALAAGLSTDDFGIGFLAVVFGAAFFIGTVCAYGSACGRYANALGYSETLGVVSLTIAILTGIVLYSAFGSGLTGSVVAVHLLPLAAGYAGILPYQLLPDRRASAEDAS